MAINYDGIVIIDAFSGIPLFSKLTNIDGALFSGFITAISKFSEELSLGALSSFTTDEKHIFLVAREKIVVAIICEIRIDFKEVFAFASKIASQFEENYDMKNVTEVSLFDGFIKHIESIEKEDIIPFPLRVAEFATKEFGNKISLDVSIIGSDKNKYKIDLMVDNGEKSSGSFRDKSIRKMINAYSEDIFLIKIIDGTAGMAEVSEFLESMKLFGIRPIHEKTDDQTFPYFPSKAIIIARDYSPTVFEKLKEYPSRRDKTYISGSHILPSTRAKFSPDTSKCFIEIWQWFDDKYPERVHN